MRRIIEANIAWFKNCWRPRPTRQGAQLKHACSRTRRQSSGSCQLKRLTKRRLIRHEFSRSTCANESARFRCVFFCGIDPISAGQGCRLLTRCRQKSGSAKLTNVLHNAAINYRA